MKIETNKEKQILFVLITIGVFIYIYNSKNYSFYYDSLHYWELGKSFERDGRFSILSYNNSLRGYLLPLLNYLIYNIARILEINEVLFFRAVSGFTFSWFTVFFCPNFGEKILKSQINIYQRLIFSLAMIYFWRGYILYPLSDLVSLYLLFLGIYLALRLDITNDKSNNFREYFSIGILIGGASIVRPSYLVAIPIVLIYVSTKSLMRNRYKGAGVILVVLGLITVYFPQAYINHHNFQTSSPFIQTQRSLGNSLYLSQLKWGLEIQRYETSISSDYPRPQMYFYDKHGLLLSETIDIGSINNYMDYIRNALKYPLDFKVMYFKHLFNGLDITWPTPYVTDVYKNRTFFSLANYSIIFVSLILLYKSLRKIISDVDILFVLATLLSTVALSIPGAVEIRFFLPLYIMMYMIVFYTDFVRYIRFNYLHICKEYFFHYILFILVCFTLSVNTFAMLEHRGALINAGSLNSKLILQISQATFKQ